MDKNFNYIHLIVGLNTYLCFKELLRLIIFLGSIDRAKGLPPWTEQTVEGAGDFPLPLTPPPRPHLVVHMHEENMGLIMSEAGPWICQDVCLDLEQPFFCLMCACRFWG